MQRHLVKLAVLVAIAVGWWMWRQRIFTQPPVPAAGMGTAGAGSAARADRHEVRQVSREAREHLAAQIQAAHDARAAAKVAAAAAANGSATGAAPAVQHAAPGEAPALPEADHTHDLDKLGEPVLTALQGAIPFLADCYKQGSGSGARPSTAVAQMTLSNDPDIGAVIDPDQIRDDKQQPLDPAIDACLRGTMQTLELPPLDAGDVVKLQYSFKLD